MLGGLQGILLQLMTSSPYVVPLLLLCLLLRWLWDQHKERERPQIPGHSQ
jgi:hypothetical protein